MVTHGQTASDATAEIVLAYHERTKHHYHRYAASVGRMDWATQPDPFRRYSGADLVRLPLPQPGAGSGRGIRTLGLSLGSVPGRIQP